MGDPGALLYVSFAGEPDAVREKLDAWERLGHGYHMLRAETGRRAQAR